MTKKLKVAVIGVTGNVGQQLLAELAERKFPVQELIAVASDQSVGKKVSFGNDTLSVIQITNVDFNGIDLAFFCAGSAVAKQYAHIAIKAGCTVIDKSSYFRLDETVPLIVPEVNVHLLENLTSKMIASPNCCTIPLSVILKPLDDIAKIKKVIVSTYQSVSGAGKVAMDELYQQTKAKYIFEKMAPKVLPNQIAFNLFPQIGNFREDGYSEEEYKIQQELKKIFGSHIAVTVTCVRVPVFVSHAMSVHVEFAEEMRAEQAEEILYEADSVVVYNLANEVRYATPVDVVESDEVFVSRIRNDDDDKRCLNMWICADNLRKGAALNAVQIGEALIQNQYFTTKRNN